VVPLSRGRGRRPLKFQAATREEAEAKYRDYLEQVATGVIKARPARQPDRHPRPYFDGHRWVVPLYRGRGHRPLKFQATTLEAAQGKYQQYLQDVADGLIDPVQTRSTQASRVSLADCYDRWMVHNADEWEATTASGYRHSFDLHVRPFAIASEALSDLDEEDFEAWRDARVKAGAGRRSIGMVLSQMRTALTFACSRPKIYGISRNVLLGVRPPRHTKRKHKATSQQDLQRLLEHVRAERWAHLVQLSLAAGLRRQEALGLQWRDVDFAQSVITVRRRVNWIKGTGLVSRDGVKMHGEGGSREIPFGQEVAMILREQQQQLRDECLRAGKRWRGSRKPTEGEAWVFPNVQGTMMAPSNLNRWFKKMCAQVGIEDFPNINPQSLRFNFSSHSQNAGTNLEKVAKLMGHTKIDVTRRAYTDFELEMLREAMAPMDKLVGRLR